MKSENMHPNSTTPLRCGQSKTLTSAFDGTANFTTSPINSFGVLNAVASPSSLELPWGPFGPTTKTYCYKRVAVLWYVRLD